MKTNRAAIKAAGLSETEPDPFGGFYQRVPGTNVINGVPIGYAEFDFLRRTRMQLSDEAFIGYPLKPGQYPLKPGHFAG